MIVDCLRRIAETLRDPAERHGSDEVMGRSHAPSIVRQPYVIKVRNEGLGKLPVFPTESPTIKTGGDGVAESEATAEKVGRRLKVIRKWKGATQQDVADICGVARAAVAGWERGANRISIDQAARIVAAYGITLDYIYLGKFDLLAHGVALELQAAERLI